MPSSSASQMSIRSPTAALEVFRQLGAEIAVTYLNEKARRFVEPLARDLGATIIAPCDVANEGELEAVFAQMRNVWGSLDIALHSIAFAPKEDLQGRLVDSSAEGFKVAMDVSCHSFVRMARLAEPLMKDGGTLLAMSYHGANKVVPNYNLMGPVKAALESAVRYLAFELGGKQIRVHAVSPGPLKTRAASGLKEFDILLSEALDRAPIGELVDIDDVGLTAAFLTRPSRAGSQGRRRTSMGASASWLKALCPSHEAEIEKAQFRRGPIGFSGPRRRSMDVFSHDKYGSGSPSPQGLFEANPPLLPDRPAASASGSLKRSPRKVPMSCSTGSARPLTSKKHADRWLTRMASRQFITEPMRRVPWRSRA